MPQRTVELAWTTSSALDRIWAAWTEPSHLVRWYCDRAEGSPSVGARMVHQFDWFGFRAEYTVEKAEPQRELVLASPRGTLTIQFRSASTRRAIRLIDTGCPDDADGYQALRSGWLNALSLLKEYVEQNWDRPKQVLIELREGDFEFQRAIERYRSPLRLEWLPFGTGVLQDTGTEVVLEWPEIRGTLELKAFPWGERRMFGLRAVSWARESLEPRRAELRAAVERLQALIC